MNDLLKRLQSLGLKIDNGSNYIKEPVQRTGIESVVPGRWLESDGERVYLIETNYANGLQHGEFFIDKEQRHKGLSQFWCLENIENDDLKEFLFIDAETSGLSLGAGSLIFLFGACYFSEQGLKVIQLFLEDPSSELLFLNQIDELIIKHKYLVSYNGKTFDIPILRSRMILNHFPNENLNRGHIDLLHFARKIWKLRLDSRKLSDIEREILKYQRTDDEVPGWLVPQIYLDYLNSSDATPLKGVIYHNEKDIVSLAALFLHINKLVSDKETLISANSLDLLSIGKIYQNMGNFSVSEDFYKLGFEKQNPQDLNPIILMNFASILKKQNKWQGALNLWEIAAQRGEPLACVEISKYFEHRDKNIFQALVWVEKGIQIIKNQNHALNLMKELEKRKQRIQGKINIDYEK